MTQDIVLRLVAALGFIFLGWYVCRPERFERLMRRLSERLDDRPDSFDSTIRHRAHYRGVFYTLGAALLVTAGVSLYQNLNPPPVVEAPTIAPGERYGSSMREGPSGADPNAYTGGNAGANQGPRTVTGNPYAGQPNENQPAQESGGAQPYASSGTGPYTPRPSGPIYVPIVPESANAPARPSGVPPSALPAQPYARRYAPAGSQPYGGRQYGR